MAHILKKRTKKEAKKEGWPCWMCKNDDKAMSPIKIGWISDVCKKCRKENFRAKPSEFQLREFA